MYLRHVKKSTGFEFQFMPLMFLEFSRTVEFEEYF